MEIKTIEDAVNSVAMQMARYGYRMQPGCSEEELNDLAQRVRERFNLKLPDEYLSFLRLANGLDENGMQVFGSRYQRNVISDIAGTDYFILGLLEENEEYRADREDYDRLLVFARDGQYVYAWELASGKYAQIAHDEHVPSQTFETFDQMMLCALKRIIRE